MKYILLFLLTTLCLFAEVAKVSAVVGDAKIVRLNETIIVKLGTLIEKKDVIQTKSNSKVQLIFKDNTVVTLGKNSALDINEYIFDTKNPKNSQTDFNFFKGAFKTITGKIGKINREKFKLRTKSSTIGIRGTVVLANQDTVLCLSGEISVASGDQEVIVPQNQVTTIENGELTPPKEYTEDTLTSLSDSLEPDENSDDSNEDEDTSNNSSSSSEEESSSDEKEEDAEENKDDQNDSQEAEDEESNSESENDESLSDSNNDENAEESDDTNSPDSIDEQDSEAIDQSDEDDNIISQEDSSLQADTSSNNNDDSLVSDDTLSVDDSQEPDSITQTAQDVSDDSNEEEISAPDTSTFNMVGNALGAYVELNTTTAAANNYLHQDRIRADGTTGLFRASRAGNQVTFDEKFTRKYASSSETITKEFDESFSLSTPSSGGYTGYSDITDSDNPYTFSYTSTGGITKTGEYKIIADNMGEVFVFYHDGDAIDVPGGRAEYNELIVFGKNGLINQMNKSKIYVYKDYASMSVDKNSSGNYTESKINIEEGGFEYYNANLKSMTHISKDFHKQGAEEFIAGYNKKLKVHRNKYSFNYNVANTPALNMHSYNSGSTEVDINVMGTDFQAISYNITSTNNTKNYSTNTTTVDSSQNSGVSFLEKDKITDAKTTGTASLKGFIVADVYGESHLRTSSSNFALNVDRSNGNISGETTIGSVGTADSNGLNMKFNGEIENNTSFYINDDLFGVMLDKGDSNYQLGSTEYDLVDNSGYLIAVPDGAFDSNGVFKLFDSSDNPITSDDDSSWGYWTAKFESSTKEIFSSPHSTWVAGIETASSIVEGISANTKYNFEGAVIGTVLRGSNGTLETIITDGTKTNLVNMEFDLGAGNNSFTSGSMKFSTTSSNWDMNLSSSDVSNTGFTGTMTGTGITNGSFSGKFYGSDSIKSVGGNFSATQGTSAGVSDVAQGVFKAIKK